MVRENWEEQAWALGTGRLRVQVGTLADSVTVGMPFPGSEPWFAALDCGNHSTSHVGSHGGSWLTVPSECSLLSCP